MLLEEFPFAECSTQKLVLGRLWVGTSALSGRAGSGGMAGAWAQKAFVRPILLPHEGEPVGSGIRAPETPSKSAGPREPGAAQPRFAVWRAQGQGEKGLRCFPEPRQVGDVVCCWKSFPLQNAAPRSSFWAVGATGPRRRAAELAQEAWLGPGRRRTSRAQSRFPTKENPWGGGSGGRGPPPNHPGPGSQGQPGPALP